MNFFFFFLQISADLSKYYNAHSVSQLSCLRLGIFVRFPVHRYKPFPVHAALSSPTPVFLKLFFFCFLFFSKVEVLFIYKANGCGVFDCHHNHTEIYKKKGERVGEARLHTGERKDSITYKTVINNLIIYGFLWLEASF